MTSQPDCYATRALVLGACVALLTAFALAAPAARVEFAIGNISATSPGGQTRPLAKGADVDSGDTVNTHDGRVQLRFSDGAYVSLQPQTLFRIDEYRYGGKSDGDERGFFSLLKGGLRTITGLVGRTNKRNYRVSTTVATIGIRGTEYTLAYTKSVSGSVGEGEIEVCNGGGCLPVGSGQSFFVAGNQVKPEITSKKTDLPPSQPAGPTPSFISGDQTSRSGDPGVFILTGTQTISYATVGAATVQDRITGVFDASGAATQLTGVSGNITFPGGLEEVGNSGFVAWGRGMAQPVTGGTLLYTHYIAGLPTPLTDLSTLSANRTLATYSFVGGTSPTADLFGAAPFAVGKLNGGSLKADFAQGLVDANINLTIMNVVINATSNMKISMISTTNTFATSTFSNDPNVAGGCTASSGGCSVHVMNGFFAGPNASHAGIAYEVIAQQVLPAVCAASPCDVSGGSIKGTAAFAKNP